MNMNYMKYERKISKYSFITILISFHYIYATFTSLKVDPGLSMQHLPLAKRTLYRQVRQL